MKRKEILETATSHVTKDRSSVHGDAERSFDSIAKFWNVWLSERGLLVPGKELGAVDVTIMMDLLKTSRILTSPEHPDHWVDKAGYSACGGELATATNSKVIPVSTEAKAPRQRYEEVEGYNWTKRLKPGIEWVMPICFKANYWYHTRVIGRCSCGVSHDLHDFPAKVQSHVIEQIKTWVKWGGAEEIVLP